METNAYLFAAIQYQDAIEPLLTDGTIVAWAKHNPAGTAIVVKELNKREDFIQRTADYQLGIF